MKNWKCKIELHDYQQITGALDFELENTVYREETPGYPAGRQGGFVDVYEEKVCLRCGKYVDEITPRKEEIRKKILKNKARAKLALMMERRICNEN